MSAKQIYTRVSISWATLSLVVVFCAIGLLGGSFASAQTCEECINGGCRPGFTVGTGSCPISGFVCCVREEPAANECPAAQEGLPGGFMEFTRSIVPCSRDCDVASTEWNEAEPCTLCHLIVMVHNIYTLAIAMLIIVALFFITMGGVLFVVSSGNPDLRSKAKGIVTKTLIGFAVFLLAWLIIYWALVFISADENQLGIVKSGGKWYEFTCNTRSDFGDERYVFNEPGTVPTTPPPPPGGGAEPDDSGYTYDSGIADQTDDASQSLDEFLDCMMPLLPAAAKRISSISDSAQMDVCVNNYSRPPCAHGEYSCHYGGRFCRGESYAVDFGNESYYYEIRQAALQCNGSAYVAYEGNHVHVSIGNANGCGCN